jgi:hypothetical protein
MTDPANAIIALALADLAAKARMRLDVILNDDNVSPAVRASALRVATDHAAAELPPQTAPSAQQVK